MFKNILLLLLFIYLFISTDPMFIAKNQAHGEEFPPIVNHGMLRTLPPDNPDILLCPVWALKYYCEHTKNPRLGKTVHLLH